jgi:hypothetical protein
MPSAGLRHLTLLATCRPTRQDTLRAKTHASAAEPSSPTATNQPDQQHKHVTKHTNRC